MRQVVWMTGLDKKVVKKIMKSWVFLTNSFYAEAPPKAIFPCISGAHTDGSLINWKINPLITWEKNTENS